MIISSLLALMDLLRAPDNTLAWRTVFDAGHAPLFGLIGVATLQLLIASPLSDRTSRKLLYALALFVALLIGALSEYSQLGTARDSDFGDFARNALGSIAFLWFAVTMDSVAVRQLRIRSSQRLLHRAAAVALLATAFIPAAFVARAYAQRAAAFPTLSSFEEGWASYFLETYAAHLEFAEIPGELVRSAHITFLPARYPAFRLIEPYPDWTGYRTLNLTLFTELNGSVDLVVRIHDRLHDDRLSDRFNRVLTIQPGLNEIAIPLADVRSAPVDRQLDLTSIRGWSLFAIEPADPFSIYVVDLRLD